MDILNKLQSIVSADIVENEILAPHTSFKIGGPAKYFYITNSKDELIKLIKEAKKLKLPYLVLGGGSNLLISDKGFDGLVIKVSNRRIKVSDNKLQCGSGTLLSKAVGEALSAGLSGLEWAIGIPGTIGGAACNNAGAYDGEMSHIIEELEVIKDDSVKKIKNKRCDFSYRCSTFRNEENHDIIWSVTLGLKSADKKEIKSKMDETISKRKEKMDKYPSAGSVFKNHHLKGRELKSFIAKYPNLPEKHIKQGVIPAAWLIEGSGLKGKIIGGAQVSEKHTGRIINIGEATAENVIMLISIIKQKVRSRFNIQLMEEIDYVGF